MADREIPKRGSPMPLSEGQILKDRYRIAALLGQGGFGAVYSAWDTTFELTCALKENFDTSPESQRQFLREAKLLHTLRHPNLPLVKDYFVIPEQGQYLVMDYVEGEDLQEKLEKSGGPLSEEQALPWIVQVCDALSYLHGQDPPVIHRDIKPANIKITPQGKAVLVDFGIAKLYNPSSHTTLAARAVTPGFSPNEQYRSGGGTDPRTDIYALGATLYTLLTGRAPLEAPERNMGTALKAPRSLNPSISAGLETAILHALEMMPDQRFQSVAEFKSALLEGRAKTAGTTPAIKPPAKAVAGALAETAKDSDAPSEPEAELVTPVRMGLGTIVSLVLLGLVLLVGLTGLAGVGLRVKNSRDGQQTALALAFMVTRQALSATPNLAATQTREEGEMRAVLTRSAATEQLRAARSPMASATREASPTVILPTQFFTTPTAAPITSTPRFRLTTDVYGIPLAMVEAGAFKMGSRKGDSDEQPVHTVLLNAFLMDAYEVTNLSYAQCVQAGACTRPGSSKSSTRTSYYGNPAYAYFPVINVDWQQAKNYCEWRGARLPSEAEWEKAARGGLEGLDFPWGNGIPDCSKANFASTCSGDTTAVGSYSPNGYGIYDMAGNVMEWVMDWYSEGYYSDSPAENPNGPGVGKTRVARGGAWDSDSLLVRLAYRFNNSPLLQDDSTGFRCARYP